MKRLQMVDLGGQYEKIQAEVDSAILNVVRSAAFINGPSVKEFQSDFESYLGVKHVIPCANGTDALQIAFMALGLEPGDEVIAPSFTFVATAEMIALLQLKPVLVDVEEGTFNMDINSLRKAITPKTKAIVPVHLFGQSANMEAVMQIAEENGLFVIEDNAQSVGARIQYRGSSRMAGTVGDFGTTSFFPAKNLGCYGDGGALWTNDDDLAAHARQVVNHGMTVRYYHDVIGVNSRLDSIQAAVLKIKLAHLDEYCEARASAAKYYDGLFENSEHIITPERYEGSTHVFHQYTLQLKNLDRDALISHLHDQNIPAAVYYPVPLHLQKAYRSDRYSEGDFPVTERLSKEVFSLPMHTELTSDQQDHIAKAIIEFIEKNI